MGLNVLFCKMGILMVATDFIGELKGLPVGVDDKHVAYTVPGTEEALGKY